MSIKINNKLKLCGSFDEVKEIINKLKGENTDFDFSKIIPIDNINDVVMDDYVNDCLNIFIDNVDESEREKYVKTFEFVGKTREIPYDFKRKKIIKEKYDKMLSDAKSFVSKIKDKSIFNGFFIRENVWGIGNNATEVKTKENIIEFVTYDAIPLDILNKLSHMYPNIKFYYTYVVDNETENEMLIVNGESTLIKGRKIINKSNAFKSINENVLV